MRRPTEQTGLSRIAWAALLTVLAVLTVTGCTGGEDTSAEGIADATTSAAPSGSTDAAGSAADSAEDRFAALLEEHREVDYDPGDEPAPEEAYAAAMAEHAADLSDCGLTPTTVTGDCERPDSLGEDLEETINIQLLLDASGSMADPARGGTKMQVAQRVLRDFVATLPESANVSLRVFGHVGTGSGADKPRSCAATERRVPFVPATSPRLRRGIGSVRPAGWTPLAKAMNEARKDLDRVGGEGTSNFVYVLSDGIETCEGAPVAAARRLSQAGVGVDVNIVGFDVDREAARQLQRAARAAGGSYADAQDADDLEDAFTSYDWAAWTRYYNCRTGTAIRNYNSEASTAIRNANCVTGRVIGEANRITGEAIGRANQLTGAALREYNAILGGLRDDPDPDPELHAEVQELAVERRDALMERAREIRDHVLDEARERRDTLVEAARRSRDGLLAAALEERDAILAEAQAARDAAQP